MRSQKITCPKCKVSLSVHEKFRGQVVRCGSCGRAIHTTPVVRKLVVPRLRAG
jgi:hypothetical protein